MAHREFSDTLAFILHKVPKLTIPERIQIIEKKVRDAGGLKAWDDICDIGETLENLAGFFGIKNPILINSQVELEILEIIQNNYPKGWLRIFLDWQKSTDDRRGRPGYKPFSQEDLS